jgi:hypothetical protein
VRARRQDVFHEVGEICAAPRTPDLADLREGRPVHAKDSLCTCRRNARTILLDYAASKPPVEAKASYICLEDPQVQPSDRCPCRKLTDSITKQPLTYSLTTSLRANVKIVYQTSPDRIEITIAADEPLHEPSRVAGNIHQLSCGRIAEPLGPYGEPVSFDAAAQEFWRENVGIRVTPACDMDRSDECCVILSSRSDK